MIELFAAVSTLLCVLMLNMKNIWGWPVGILAAGLYSYVFFDVELYGQVLLQGVFIAQSIFGWYWWKRDTEEVVIKSIGTYKLQKWVGVITLGMTILMLHLIAQAPANTETITNALFRATDMYVVILSLMANWLLSLKIYQSWLLWIYVDVIMIGLMISQELWWSVGLYVILLINAIDAYVTWTKDYDLEQIR
jgi:nicotinamide mononucleotide transporter